MENQKNTVLLESRPFRPFKSGDEYLFAMREDLAEWLQTMYPHLGITTDNFFEKLETGVALCEVRSLLPMFAYVSRQLILIWHCWRDKFWSRLLFYLDQC